MKKKIFVAFLILGAIAMWTMSFRYLQNEDVGILRNKKVATHLWYVVVFRSHVLFGLIAILTGPIQFIQRIRLRYTLLHKGLGYVYFVAVFFSSISGLVIAQFSMGGWVTQFGFTILSILWFIITLKSIFAIIRFDVIKHEKWSHLGYALTFASITQRTLLLVPLLVNVPFIDIYRLSAWLPWMLNLWIANRLYQSKFSKHKLTRN